MREKTIKIKFSNKIYSIMLPNGSGFDAWIFLNNPPYDKRIVVIIKKGKIIFDLKVFNGYIQNNKNKLLNIYILDVVWLIQIVL